MTVDHERQRRAAEARGRLREALDELVAADGRTPCAGWPNLWDSDDAEDRAAAARGCRRCPILAECAAVGPYECSGVWGGRDHDRHPTNVRTT